ncbi:MAG: 2-keto-4-pentenoate hydratase, partial [Microvirgula sp.]
MKLASIKHGRDGRLVVVSRDLSRCVAVPGIAPTLQTALDQWELVAPRLADIAAALDNGELSGSLPFVAADCAAPLPRAYLFADGSAFLSHVELVRRARGADMPAELYQTPLMYQGDSGGWLAPTAP